MHLGMKVMFFVHFTAYVLAMLASFPSIHAFQAISSNKWQKSVDVELAATNRRPVVSKTAAFEYIRQSGLAVPATIVLVEPTKAENVGSVAR